MNDVVVLETERLLLRYFAPGDVDALERIFGDPEVMGFGDGVRSRQWLSDWIGRWLDDWYPTWGFGMWAVVDAGGEVLGYCGLSRRPEYCRNDEAEIGYRFAKRHWGRGFATEAARAVRDHALGALAIPRLIAFIDPENTASIRVAEKIGMRYERDAMFKGYTHPDRVYAVTLGSP